MNTEELRAARTEIPVSDDDIERFTRTVHMRREKEREEQLQREKGAQLLFLEHFPKFTTRALWVFSLRWIRFEELHVFNL